LTKDKILAKMLVKDKERRGGDRKNGNYLYHNRGSHSLYKCSVGLLFV